MSLKGIEIHLAAKLGGTPNRKTKRLYAWGIVRVNNQTESCEDTLLDQDDSRGVPR